MDIKKLLWICAVIVFIGVGCSQEKASTDTANKDGEGVKSESQLPKGHPGVGEGSPDVGGLKSDAKLPGDHPTTDNATLDRSEVAKVAHSGEKKGPEKPVKLSDEVKAAWNEVTIEVSDGKLETSETLKVKLGAVTKIGDTGYSVKVEHFVPEYTIFGDHIGSRGVEPKNPAILVEVLEGDKSIARGWVFKSFQDFNTYSHERFSIALKGPSAG